MRQTIDFCFCQALVAWVGNSESLLYECVTVIALCCVGSPADVSGVGAGVGQWPVSGRRQVFLMDGSSIPIPPDCQCQCVTLSSHKIHNICIRKVFCQSLFSRPSLTRDGRKGNLDISPKL